MTMQLWEGTCNAGEPGKVGLYGDSRSGHPDTFELPCALHGTQAADHPMTMVRVPGDVACQWSLPCTEPAEWLMHHPTLGPVPTCNGCADRSDAAPLN